MTPKEKRNLGLGLGAGLLALVVVGAIATPDEEKTSKRSVSSSSSVTRAAPTTTVKPLPGTVVPEGVQIRTEQDASGEVVVAEFDIGDAIFMSLTKFGARSTTKEILEYAKFKYPQASRVEVRGRFPTEDAYGNSQNSVVLDVYYTRATLDKINFSGIDNDKVWVVRDGGTIHPELQ